MSLSRGEDQAVERIVSLCHRLGQDVVAYDESKDPQLLDSISLKLELLLRHLLATERCNDILEDLVTANSLVCHVRGWSGIRPCSTTIAFNEWKTPL